MLSIKDKKIYIASEAIDFRMSIDGLSQLIQKNKKSYLHDGSIYVFYNKAKNKIKCLFWDKNGFVLYYKRLEGTQFKFKKMTQQLATLSAEELEVLLSGYEPIETKTKPHLVLEHNA
jgi:transposase